MTERHDHGGVTTLCILSILAKKTLSRARHLTGIDRMDGMTERHDHGDVTILCILSILVKKTLSRDGDNLRHARGAPVTTCCEVGRPRVEANRGAAYQACQGRS